MASLHDGLGGEELQISGLQAGGVNISPYFTGSVSAASGFADDSGKIKSVSAGSPGAFGALVQAGSAGTAAGSGGFIALRQPFASSEYFVAITGFSGTSVAGFISGVQNAASGTNFIGGASGRYNWIAVGL